MQGRGKGWLVRDRVLEKGRRQDPTAEGPGDSCLAYHFHFTRAEGRTLPLSNSLEQKIGSEAAAYVVS